MRGKKESQKETSQFSSQEREEKHRAVIKKPSEASARSSGAEDRKTDSRLNKILSLYTDSPDQRFLGEYLCFFAAGEISFQCSFC